MLSPQQYARPFLIMQECAYPAEIAGCETIYPGWVAGLGSRATARSEHDLMPSFKIGMVVILATGPVQREVI